MSAAASVILVVDDTTEVRVFIRRLLERNGFRVLEAGTGEMGLELVETWSPDLVILDLGLPGIDGVAVAAAIRTHPDESVRRVPLLACSATVDQRRIAGALEAGCDAFEAKPITVAGFLQTVRSLLDERLST